MNSFEKDFIISLHRYKDVLFFIIITFMAFFVRFAGRECQSMDFVYFLKPWYEEIKNAGGLAALDKQIGNYGLLYQTIIAFMTYIDTDCLYQYKVFSCIFDFCCAVAAAEFAAAIVGEKRFKNKYNIVYAAVLMMPTSIINGAYWAQCDSIYSFFLILTVLLMYKEKYKSAFVAYGFAFAFKFQSIFMLPFILCCWIAEKKFSIVKLLIGVLTFWASGIIAYLSGRNIFDAFNIYFAQAKDNIQMYNNFPSFWLLFNDDYNRFGSIASFLAITIIGIGAYTIMYGYKKLDSGERKLNTAAWFIWTAIMFMPNMHDRYAFTLDIMLVTLSCINVKYAKFAVVSVLLSTMSYGSYLASQPTRFNAVTAAIYLIAWGYYGYTIVKDDISNKSIETKIIKK